MLLLPSSQVSLLNELAFGFFDKDDRSLKGVANGEVSQEVGAQVMGSVIHQSSSALAQGCLASPSSFHAVISWLLNMVLDWDASGVCYSMAVQSLQALGDAMVSADANATASLFCDHALPKLVPVIRSNPSIPHHTTFIECLSGVGGRS